MKGKWASGREEVGCFYACIMSLELVLGPVLGGNSPLLHQESVPSCTAGQPLGSNIFTYRLFQLLSFFHTLNVSIVRSLKLC